MEIENLSSGYQKISSGSEIIYVKNSNSLQKDTLIICSLGIVLNETKFDFSLQGKEKRKLLLTKEKNN